MLSRTIQPRSAKLTFVSSHPQEVLAILLFHLRTALLSHVSFYLLKTCTNLVASSDCSALLCYALQPRLSVSSAGCRSPSPNSHGRHSRCCRLRHLRCSFSTTTSFQVSACTRVRAATPTHAGMRPLAQQAAAANNYNKGRLAASMSSLSRHIDSLPPLLPASATGSDASHEVPRCSTHPPPAATRASTHATRPGERERERERVRACVCVGRGWAWDESQPIKKGGTTAAARCP